MQKYRVYTDGETQAECIVVNCEAQVCSFKDARIDRTHPARRRGKQGAFCVEHHNQLVDLKVRRLPVVWLLLRGTQLAFQLGNAMASCLPPCH